jgi:hypothetical protein
MNLINITVDHFVTAEGKAVLSVDQNGFPQISEEMVTKEEKELAALALAIYTNCQSLHASQDNVDTAARWVRQYKYYD